MPSNFIIASAFSPSKTYLALGGRGPAITIYKRENNTFTKLVSPTIGLSGDLDGTAIAFSRDEQFLYLMSNRDSAVNFFFIFQRTGDTFQQVFSQNIGGTQIFYTTVNTTPDDKYIVVPNTNGFRLYKRNLIDNSFQFIDSRSISFSNQTSSIFVTSDYKIFITSSSNVIHKSLPGATPVPNSRTFQINQDDTMTEIESVVKGDWINLDAATLFDSEEYMVGLFASVGAF